MIGRRPTYLSKPNAYLPPSTLRIATWPRSAATFTASSSQTADSERGRIEDAGGLVEEGRVISPVSGAGLQPSRTVGDYEFKV